jgi:hypothetical protein
MSVTAVSARAVPVAQPPRSGFMHQELPIRVILGSFLVLTLPLTVIALVWPGVLSRWYVVPIYVWLLGTTHFVITLTVYLQSTNLRYFSSTWKNRALYFALPAGIFLFFDLYTALHVAVTMPVLDNVFRRGIRFFDFHHVNRQSYGVLQLFKGRSRSPFPTWMKKSESAYFWSLTVLLLMTFWSNGSFDAEEPLMLIALAVVAVLAVVVIAGFVVALRRGADRRALAAPFFYFLMQSGSAALGAYSTALWMFGLAMHYVEYHVLMVPRCFDAPLDERAMPDRFFGRLRRSRLGFYVALIVLAGVVTGLTWSAMGPMLLRARATGSTGYLALIALFDGLFVFHYFIESLIWKFGQPFYRQTLGPLYFGAPAQPKPVTATVGGES